jgi:complex iron-sulfur molybdoenzyme family reductase subunit gamma
MKGMLAKRVPDVAAILDPASKGWQQVEAETIELVGMPLHLQTSRYVRTVWADKLIGKVRAMSVRAAHDGERVAFLLEWNDATQNAEFADRQFPDAAAVVFPSNGAAPLATMGNAQAGVNQWFWRADLERPENRVANGLGTDRTADDVEIGAGAAWNDGRWSVVLSRKLKAKGTGTAALAPGKTTNVAFSVWEGSNQERGDLHSYSRDWRDLALEP